MVLVVAERMHDEEMNIDTTLVHGLLAAQFPHWADRRIEPVNLTGSDNVLYRLGDDLAVRLPRLQDAARRIGKEHQWLPRIAPLPLAIPQPLAQGAPAPGYPWPWSISRWLPGQDATVVAIADPAQASAKLGRFVAILHQLDPAGGPPPGEHNFFRGVPLAERDAHVHAAIESLVGIVDTRAASQAWATALQAPAWTAAPVWIHGDLHAANLLVHQGQLSAVIDFGGLGVGDPACDMMVAWTLFSAQTREVFRSAARGDDATWARGKGWALSFGLIALPYYIDTDPRLARIAQHTIDEVLTDQEDNG
ncbi:MAG: aminoglycoside phosphotransferase family protein [Pseudonocardiaceae bacterium]